MGKVSPRDLRRTAITRALDQALSHRQARMMIGRKSLEMVLRYDHHRESKELNAVNFLDYAEPPPGRPRINDKATEEKSNDQTRGKGRQ
jgi:hypothetical protein